MTVARYRKKPVEIEAEQWHEQGDPTCPSHITCAEQIVAWVNINGGEAQYQPLHEATEFGTACVCNGGDPTKTSSAHPERIVILTLEGPMSASPGDYVIRGIKGEFYPCKPDVFDASYDAV